MKVIFLDFDGVLVTRQSFLDKAKGEREKGHPPCVSALNRITNETGAHIVVSSCWRFGASRVELQELLTSWGVTGKVIDKTPNPRLTESNVYVANERGDEIDEWLKKCPESPDRFVIIDDDVDMGKYLPHLVKTDIENGLTMEHAVKAIGILMAAAEAKV